MIFAIFDIVSIRHFFQVPLYMAIDNIYHDKK